jgi:hypothetical protein
MNFQNRLGLTLAINGQGQVVARIISRGKAHIHNALTTGRKVTFEEGMNFQARISGKVVQTATLDEMKQAVEAAYPEMVEA